MVALGIIFQEQHGNSTALCLQHILDGAVGSPTRECLSVCRDTFLEGRVAMPVLSVYQDTFFSLCCDKLALAETASN